MSTLQAPKAARRPVPSPGEPPRTRTLTRLRARVADPELGLSAFLLVFGVTVLVSAATIAPDAAGRGPVGPRAVPTFIGIGLCVIAVAHAIDVLRGGHGEAEAGEDIELGTPPDWRTVGLLVGAFAANVLLIDVIGWPLSGALMFWLGARALGSRHPGARHRHRPGTRGHQLRAVRPAAGGSRFPAGPLTGLL